MSRHASHLFSLGCAVLALATACTAGAAAGSPGDLLTRIRVPTLEPSNAVRVRSLEVDLGKARLTLDEGVLVPAAAIEGRVVEIVFVGSARFIIAPDDAVEAQQLKLFTGTRALETPVASVMLVVGDRGLSEQLLDRESAAPLGSDLGAGAQELFEKWVSGPVRRGSGAEAAIFKALVGDRAFGTYFATWCQAPDGRDFYYLYDPAEDEQIELGRFVPWDKASSDSLAASIEREERGKRKKRRGRFDWLQLDELGYWDTWVASALRDADGELRGGSPGFEATHYELDLFVDPEDEKAEGTARLTLRATAEGRRVVTLTLHPALDVQSAQDGSGLDLFSFRAGREVHILLSEPAQPDEPLVIDIVYSGRLLHRLEGGVWATESTQYWYPRFESGRATYDTTLRWRQKYLLGVAASGRVVDGGVEAGIEWQRRTLDRPSIGFSLEFGKFDVYTRQVGHIELTVAISSLRGEYDEGVKKELVETVADALTFFEERFGRYPLDYLTVATVPRDFSQGLLGFITLADGLIRVRVGYRSLDTPEQRRRRRTETIAHEVSHQWWGNKVGWVSYRDQWLSEALADYSAVLYSAARAKRQSVYLAQHALDWRSALNQRARNGQSVESLGPVVLGQRLDSSFSDDAYAAVVYTKGSVVFSMLARILGEEPLVAMLRALADRVNNRDIDTATFLAALEHMSGADLGSFANRFIYGTGIPSIYYDYEIKPAERERWLIEGEVHQTKSSGPRYRYRLSRTKQDTWDIARELQPTAGGSHFLVVPFQVLLKQEKKSKDQTAAGLGGTLTLDARTSPFSIPLDREPERFWLDQRGEVLADFRDGSSYPKASLLALSKHQKSSAAIDTLLRALEAPIMDPTALQQAGKTGKQYVKANQSLDADIYFRLAAAFMDLDRSDEAAEAFRQGREIAAGQSSFSRSLECRLLSRRGDYDGLFETMREWERDLARLENQLLALAGQVGVAGLEGSLPPSAMLGGAHSALMAAAAFETGRIAEMDVALDTAKAYGVDMTLLEELLDQE